MTIYGIITIVSILILIILIFMTKIGKFDMDDHIILCTILITCAVIFTIISLYQKFDIRQEQIRYTKEREQIIYQIENMTENTDKIKLNEWILSYNDWVNDINSNKETFGIFSWYYSIDMSNHQIILLQ